MLTHCDGQLTVPATNLPYSSKCEVRCRWEIYPATNLHKNFGALTFSNAYFKATGDRVLGQRAYREEVPWLIN
jgi:hypothetical protein